MSYQEMFSELFFGYIALFIVVKINGKTQITQITPFDLISSLVLGNLLGDGIYDSEATLAKILFSVFTWGALILVTEFLTQKSVKARKLLEGDASVVIKHGAIQWKELKRNRLDTDQLMQLLRTKDTFSVSEVAFAILENDGTVSVLKKSDFDTPTKQDLKIQREKEFLPVVVISDGKIMKRALNSLEKDENWVHKKLKEADLSLKQVCFAEWDSKQLHLHTY
ncbi:DUF421 domain-containing protein [Gottfriedia luciferensis]|uniref:DUF421 domain-containing protein n=1 Tax=Gottfriedia luciferensis TaxID=178774 RepID=UPI000B437055|nr:DUF421 domain-containing protein [Gottfriedia luciferensis]